MMCKNWSAGCLMSAIAARHARRGPAISKADLEILFIRLCAKQRWSADQPAQKLMRASTFVRALRELADRAFPEEADTSTRFARLLEHIERNVASAAEDGAASDVASARGACASRL